MASKSKRRGRVFRASCILAALIIAGSSFAWFTGKDEVTNRLTATADYGVSLVEDFAPPKQMTPGQNVNKDVSVVNTGSIDAFTRVALENQLEITTLSSSALTLSVDTTSRKTVSYFKIDKVTTTTGTTQYASQSEAEAAFGSAANTVYTAVGDDTNGWYIQTVITETLTDRYTDSGVRNTQVAALNGVNTDATINYQNGTNENVETVYNTTKTAPTAGVLATGVKLSDGQSLNNNTGKLTPNEVTTLQAGGTLVMAASEIIPASDQFVVAGDDTTPPAQTDYDGAGQFTPGGEGLYVFKRTVYEDAGNGETKYSGYYYDGNDFYALKTEIDTTSSATGSTYTPYIDFGTGGITLDTNGEITGISGVKLLTKHTYKTAGIGGSGDDIAKVTVNFGKYEDDNGTDKFTKENSSANYNDKTKVNAIQLTVTTGSSDTDNETKIYIVLDSDWTEKWQLVEPSSATTDVADWFYYKGTVKSGETTKKLVDYVRIDNRTNQTNFVDLTYDLNAVLESVQVTFNQEGDQTADAITTTSGWAKPTVTTNPVLNNGNVSSIDSVSWGAWS